MAVATSTNRPAAQDDLLAALHEEIARLPEKYRLAVVHCDLEGQTQAQAAGQLHRSERTIQCWLAEGRARLKRRLARRGLAPDGATLGAIFLRESRAAVPAAWSEATVRAAVATVDRTVTIGVVSAAAKELAQAVFKVMLLQKLTLASLKLLAAGLMAWAAAAAWISPGDEPRAATAAAARRADPVPRPAARTDSPDEAGTVPIGGRVLDPDGKPTAGAEVYVRPADETALLNDPTAVRQKGRVAVADVAGRFHFEIDKASSAVSFDGGPGWHKALIAAAAPGFAPGWVEAGGVVEEGEATLRLVRDDVPVRGRVLDSQGRPVAGVVVRIRTIWELKDGVDRDALLASGELPEDMSPVNRQFGRDLGPAAPTWQPDPGPFWPGGRNAWTTGADGRFEVRGIGRDRVARLEFHGGGVADCTLDVMARSAKTLARPRPRPSVANAVVLGGRDFAFVGRFPQATALVGATFDYIAGPTKPIAGVVRLKGSGKPVEGAIVQAVDPTTHTPVIARSDATGRFRLDGVLKADYYRILVLPRPGLDPFLSHRAIIDDTEGTKPIEQAFELPPGVFVTARLVDKATGKVLPPAWLTYMGVADNVPAGATSLPFSRLAGGACGVTVVPGPGIIAASAAVNVKDDPYVPAGLKAADREKGIDDGYVGRLRREHTYGYFNAPAGSGPVALDLELTRGQSRAGRVIGPNGGPVVGAVAWGLSASRGLSDSLSLDADTFTVNGLEPGQARPLIFMHKARKVGGAVVLKDEDLKSTAPLEVKLLPAGAITGRFVDEDGLPLARARIQIAIFDLNGQNLPDGVETVTADAEGRFRLEGFVSGVDMRVAIEASNRPDVPLDGGDALRKPSVGPGEVRDLGDVKVKPLPQ
jgi:Sigma-70, region 4